MLKLFTEVGLLDETQQSAKGAMESLSQPEVYEIHKTENLQVWEHEKDYTKHA